MKKISIVALIFTASVVCGCDFFRSLAGRPTSDEINARRTAIELAEKEQARADSVRLAEKAAAEKNERDSLSALSRIDSLGISVITISSLGGVENVFSEVYAIVVGSFKSASNAAGMAEKVSEAGYPAVILTFKNGMSAVTVAPCRSISDAVEAYGKVRNEKFCPKDAWILKNE